MSPGVIPQPQGVPSLPPELSVSGDCRGRGLTFYSWSRSATSRTLPRWRGRCAPGLDAVRGTAFWKIPDDDLLSLAETLERVGRLVYAAQVHLLGELDTRRVFQ